MTEEQWLMGTDPEAMRKSVPSGNARKRRLFACACCRRAWGEFTPESRLELEASERLADGAIKRKQVEPIREAAVQAHQTLPQPKTRFVRLQRISAWTCCRHASDSEIVRGAFSAAMVVRDLLGGAIAGPPPYDGMGPPDEENQRWQERYEAARKNESAWQAAALRDIFGNPFHPVEFDPSWRAAVAPLAATIYEERSLPGGELDAIRLAALTDALVEAGCANELVLSHLRRPGLHYRGCWVVDQLLDKK